MNNNKGLFPIRYRCSICGGRLSVFHLCWQCLQPIHPQCVCHPLPEQQEDGTGLHKSSLAYKKAA